MIADYKQRLLVNQAAMSDHHHNILDEDADWSSNPSTPLVSPSSIPRLISNVKKAMPISTSTHSDTPLVTEKPNTLVSCYHEGLRRSRIKQKPLNVRELGNVSNYVTPVSDSSTDVIPNLEDTYTATYIGAILKELDDTSKNYKAAMTCPQKAEWETAIAAETASLDILKTWIIVDIPKNCHLKTGAFIFKKKYTSSEIKYKARL
jgi:hypothetical protein